MHDAAEEADRTRRFTVTPAQAGTRLDALIALLVPEVSRSRAAALVEAGEVRLNGEAARKSARPAAGDVIEVRIPPPVDTTVRPQDIPLLIRYEDADLLVIDKPAGLVVHPAPGHAEGTLVNALLHHFAALSGAGGEERPGIVHRIDKDTSGVLLVARHDAAHRKLAAQFAGRQVEKVYLALVEGRLKRDSGRIEKPISRDPVRRVRMTARLGAGRSAVTDYQVLRRYKEFTFLEVRIGTGRTHQIRVHLASINHPVAGDRLYGARAADYGRFFLHAQRIAFHHPSTGERVTVKAPLPPELERWLQALL